MANKAKTNAAATPAEDEDEQLAFINEASEADSFEDDEQDLSGDLPTPPSPEAGSDQPATQNADTDADDLLDSDALNAAKPEEAAQAAAPQAEQQPAAPAEQAPQAEAPQPTPGQEQAPAAQQEQPSAPSSAAQPSSSSPQEMVGVYNDWRKESEDLLASHHYNLSHEQAEELELEPHKAIPKLMARVYLDAVTAAIGQVTTHLPRMVRLVTEQEQANARTEQTFYDSWPDLKEHNDTVVQIGQAYRAQNPSASAEDFIKNVGAMAMVALKKPIQGQPASQQAPATPSQAPFVPAAQSPVGGIPQKAPVQNIFTQLDSEMFEEEL